MFSYPYAKPSVTATVFAFYNGMMLVGTRGKNVEAFPGLSCAPGGFLEAHYVSNGEIINQGETAEDTAIREFQEECSVTLDGDQLILFHEHSGVETDPRCHVVNLCYIVNLRKDQVERLMPGDDLMALDLVPIESIKEGKGPYSDWDWAFNHSYLARMAVLVWEHGGDYFQAKGNWSA